MLTWQSLALALAVCCLLVVSQLLLKHSVEHHAAETSGTASLLRASLTRATFWLAVLSTIIGAALWLKLLLVSPISLVYPLLSLSYVLMVPAARVVFGEPVTVMKLTGTIIIFLGVVVVSRGPG